MPHPDTELIFPPRIIPDLAGLRGAPWQTLVRRVAATPEGSLERTAFVLLMARLNNCSACNPGSYRALQGCTRCTQQTLTRHKESDDELVELFANAYREVEKIGLKTS